MKTESQKIVDIRGDLMRRNNLTLDLGNPSSTYSDINSYFSLSDINSYTLPHISSYMSLYLSPSILLVSPPCTPPSIRSFHPLPPLSFIPPSISSFYPLHLSPPPIPSSYPLLLFLSPCISSSYPSPLCKYPHWTIAHHCSLTPS